MSSDTTHPVPTEINLHRKSRLLGITFSDGRHFDLPCEYLRVFSHAAEEKARLIPVSGKEQVNIDSIEPQGNYAIRIAFDDGHDTGIYSWDSLYQLGLNQEANWQRYLERLAQAGLSRSDADAGPKQLTMLYFAYLAKYLRTESEQVQTPAQVSDVQSLLAFLRQRARDKAYLLADDLVRVTVNKQFAEPFTKLADGDEVALVPTQPTPPPPPKQPKPSRDDDW
jgi:DUF971 family protein/molybdopterin converting factor small subunit